MLLLTNLGWQLPIPKNIPINKLTNRKKTKNFQTTCKTQIHFHNQLLLFKLFILSNFIKQFYHSTDLIRKICDTYEFIFNYTNKMWLLKLKVYNSEIKKSNSKIIHCNWPLNHPRHIFIKNFHCKFLTTPRIILCPLLCYYRVGNNWNYEKKEIKMRLWW